MTYYISHHMTLSHDLCISHDCTDGRLDSFLIHLSHVAATFPDDHCSIAIFAIGEVFLGLAKAEVVGGLEVASVLAVLAVDDEGGVLVALVDGGQVLGVHLRAVTSGWRRGRHWWLAH